jgi:hypothetical protein
MPKGREPVLVGKRDTLKHYGQLEQVGRSEWYTGCWPYAGFFDKRKNRQDILLAAARAEADLVLCEDHVSEHGGHFEVRFYRQKAAASSESEPTE